ALIVLAAAVLCPACSESGTAKPLAVPEKTAEKAAPKTLDDAIALAKAEGKNVLVEYTSTKCPFCRQMNAQTLNQADVKAALASKVVWFRSVKEKNPEEFTAKFGVQPTPTFLVLDGEGKTLHGPVSGVIPKANFLSYVDWAAKGTGPVPALSPGSS
ncbi:MAG: thioredoxin fold domain-containing protein, partial [Planctomycetota bacterium]